MATDSVERCPIQRLRTRRRQPAQPRICLMKQPTKRGPGAWPRGLFLAASTLALAVVSLPVAAQGKTPPSGEAGTSSTAVNNSRMDTQIFYEILMGEMLLQSGEPDAAFEFMLDAARRTRDETTFRRATDMAIQGRAGPRVLQAAHAWQSALPDSIEANSYLVRILSILGRADEAQAPLTRLLKLTPESDRADLLASITRFFSRSGSAEAVPALIGKIAADFEQTPELRAAGSAAVGRAWLQAKRSDKALEAAQSAQSRSPQHPYGAQLALELWPAQAQAQAVIQAHLQTNPKSTGVRLQYARALAEAQHYQAAVEQLNAVTREQGDRTSAWLTLGALHVQLREPERAIECLKKVLELSPAAKDTPPVTPPSKAASPSAPGEADTRAVRQQALQMLSRAEELRGDLPSAERWLDAIEETSPSLGTVQRRASLRAAQGKLSEARALIRAAPETEPDAARIKVAAEASLLRDAKRFDEAFDVLGMGVAANPNDTDLLYEQAMVADRLKRHADMEALLRRAIAIKPDHAQAHNALGYSLAERNLRLPEARHLVERALELAPGDPYITDSLGWIEFRLGNLTQAERLLSQAYGVRPDTEIGAHLGEVLWRLGRQAEAIQIWREARQRDPANEILLDTLKRLRPAL